MLLLKVSIIEACRLRVRGRAFIHAAELQTSHSIKWALGKIRPPWERRLV